MLPATKRLEAYDVDRLIRQQSYFVVHAPRQVGKTTAMEALARELTASGDYVATLKLQDRSNQPKISERTSAEPATTPTGRSLMLIRA